MTLKELKIKLAELPPEYDNLEVVFGEATFGEKLKKIQKLGMKLF